MTAPTCPACGTAEALSPEVTHLTEKRRRKFGLAFILLSLTVVGFPVAVLVWLALPRKKVTVSVDRYWVCGSCDAEIPAASVAALWKEPS